MNLRKIFVFLIPIIFLIVSLITLKNYGISWDEPEHFLRGQGYLHYYLTGQKTYETQSLRHSYYQDKSLPAEHFFKNDDGHPPASDILASLTNYVFYQKLNIFGDIESYHLYNVIVSTLLVFVVSVFSYKVLGLFPSIVSSLVVAFYPLFFAESKFNVKDPAQAAFYTLTIFAFWMSLKKNNWKWLMISAISCGLSLGTKFNILFIPGIIVPYIFVRYWSNIKGGFFNIFSGLKKVKRSYLFLLFLYPIIVLALFYILWPFLWENSFEHLLKIIGYYKDIGTGFEYQPGFYIWKFNLYPIFWILTTTPPVTIILCILGLLYSLNDKTKEKSHILWMFWFLLPIFRVTVPGSSIYGGVRQIMEFVPAMGLLCGLAVFHLTKRINKNYILKFFLTLTFVVAIVAPIIIYHPNENVYFNFLVGGLKGAVDKKVPYAGNSYGNAYKPAIDWLNENAEKNSHLALIQGTSLNIPAITLRGDIRRWNQFWSGFDRKGEYLIELNYVGGRYAYPYAWDYVETFLEPVYKVEVGGVTLAKLWKNDLEHTKPEMRKKETRYENFNISKQNNTLEIAIDNKVLLNRLVINFKETKNCPTLTGRVQSKIGSDWFTEPEPVPTEQITERKMISTGKLEFYFPAREVNGLRFVADKSGSCIFNDPKITLFVLQ